MRFPSHLLRTETIRSEPLLAAMAAVAVGMFAGAWLIGPAITHDTEPPAQTARERPSYEEMVSRPDPSPYRAATPAFDTNNAPRYAAAAKERAQAELGDPAGDSYARDWDRPTGSSRMRTRYPVFDRHRVY